MPLKYLYRCRDWLLAWCALAGLTHLHALTLGEPQWISDPGQAVVVQLPLRDWGRLSPDQIQLRLAPPSSWQAAGLQTPEAGRFQLGLKQVDTRAWFVLIQCLRACEGDQLDVLIELQWPNGRLQREIGLLLKPGAQGAKLQIPAALWVQPGDTAGALVASHLDPATDRTLALLALVQANPDAFVGGNVNRLRAGAVLKLPEAAQIKSLDPAQAREAIAHQMEEFAAYRSELASLAGQTSTDDSAQIATGKVQPAQKDNAEQTTDQLTLSTSGADGTDQIAAQRQAQQTAERAAEINRNIQELNRIAQGGNQAGVPIPAQVSPVPASELIDRWVSSPYTSWAALACVLLLAGWIAVRTFRGGSGAGSSGTDTSAALPTSTLNIDFDLNLPQADSLPPLPASVHHAPTPVTKASAPGVAASSPWTEVTLDFSLAAPSPSDDPESVRLDLAQALWERGLIQTALVLVREVADDARGETAQRARQWLDERA